MRNRSLFFPTTSNRASAQRPSVLTLLLAGPGLSLWRGCVCLLLVSPSRGAPVDGSRLLGPAGLGAAEPGPGLPTFENSPEAWPLRCRVGGLGNQSYSGGG